MMKGMSGITDKEVKMKARWIKVTAIIAAMTMVAAGCGTANADKGNESAVDVESTENSVEEQTEELGESGQTVMVTDARGEVEIPADPQRIVDISGNSDMLSILGYSVVGTANSDAYDYTKFPTYLENVLEGAEILGYSMQDTMDVEAILSLDPDLIIISSVQEGMYEQLQEVAPTVMIELAQIDWTEDLMAVADIFNQTEKATEWLDSYETSAITVGEEIKATYGEDATYLAFLASAGNIYVFDAAGIGSVLYEDMGLARPEGMPEQTNISLPVVTYEGLAQIDADYIFAVGTEEDLLALQDSSIWKNMSAVKEGNVIELPASPYFNMGYSSIGRLQFQEELISLMESINES